MYIYKDPPQNTPPNKKKGPLFPTEFVLTFFLKNNSLKKPPETRQPRSKDTANRHRILERFLDGEVRMSGAGSFCSLEKSTSTFTGKFWPSVSAVKKNPTGFTPEN